MYLIVAAATRRLQKVKVRTKQTNAQTDALKRFQALLMESHNPKSVVLYIRFLVLALSFGQETKNICGYSTPAKAWKRVVFLFFKYNMVWSFLSFHLENRPGKEIGLQINQKCMAI